MKHVSMDIQGLALGLSLLGALVPFAYGQNLSKQCTEELGGNKIKIAIVVQQYEKEDYDPKYFSVKYYFPYGVTPSSVTFPLPVKDIAGPPEVITFTPYHASPAQYLVCWWIGGVYKCVK